MQNKVESIFRRWRDSKGGAAGDGGSAGHDTKDGGKVAIMVADDNGKLLSTWSREESNLIGSGHGSTASLSTERGDYVCRVCLNLMELRDAT